MIERHYIALAIALPLLAVSFFAPFMTTIGGRSVGILSGPGILAAVVLLWSIKVIWAGQLYQLRWPALLGAAGVIFTAYNTYKAQATIDLMRAATGGKLPDPAAGQLQWGWIPLVLGILFLIGAAALASEE